MAVVGGARSDVILFAGDASDKLENVAWVLETLASGYGEVVFVPGNHELWIRSDDRAQGICDSVSKLRAIQGICADLHIRTRPFLLHGRVWIVPLLSWHHASWDREPGMGGTGYAWAFSDYSSCVWPQDIPGAQLSGGTAVPTWFDAQNDGPDWEAARAAAPSHDVISMSHFLPRQELLPEKRFLFFPELPSVSGSDMLGARVDQLQPDIHIFGHSHFAWDATLDDGTRYIQAPLCSARERALRLQTVRLGLDKLSSLDPTSWLPAPVYELPLHPGPQGPAEWWEGKAAHGWKALRSGAMPPTYSAAWSEYYRRCERDPTNTQAAPWVAKARERRRRRARGPTTGAGAGPIQGQ